MFRAPPPEIAMRLAEEHRHDLLASAGKRPRDGAIRLGFPSFFHTAEVHLSQLLRWRHAAGADFRNPRKAARPRSKLSSVGELVVPRLKK
jgi:hypothetical protein